jgi:leader peptidase (prepilin peptidase) / N-methyltransferase
MTVLASAVLVSLLVMISVQDMKTLRIANGLNALLAITGVFWWMLLDAVRLAPQVGGAVLAAALLWSVRSLHTRATGRIGLGLGDIKLMGAGMVWIDPFLFPLLLFTASAAGLVGTLGFSGAHAVSLRDRRIPFGPYLSFGILVCWLLEVTR